ncbi:hypothetical protein [Chryseobacterium sp. MYb328]|uniref:hypothetical protein n=1 Tax=Chryseobacterium sp. MYb328 TaxID=2745231 RepID=UPI0030B06079
MHTTIDPIQKYKIFAEEDLQVIDPTQESTVEVYARHITWNIDELNGNLVLRGSNCHFPNLVKVKGSLSVDAENCSLPQLKTVDENFTLHCQAEINQLETVKGHFKCIIDFNFENLKNIGGSISLKKAKVFAGNQKLEKRSDVILIYHQHEADQLPENGMFNVDIFGDDIVIQNHEIYGKINVLGKNVSFPNLEIIQGDLSIKCRDKDGFHFTHDFSRLKKMMGNIKLEKTKAFFPLLRQSKNITLQNNSYASLPLLERSGSILVGMNSAANIPVLSEVNGYFNNYGSETCHLPKLKKVTGLLNATKTIACNLTEVGDIIINRQAGGHFDKLKRITGKGPSHDVDLKSLEYLGRWGGHVIKPSYSFPVLKKIKDYLYNKDEHLEYLADNVYFKINEWLYITKNIFIISKNGFYFIDKCQHYSIRKFIAVLKLKYNSFQSFMIREYPKWENYETPLFAEILEKIDLLWDMVDPVAAEDFLHSKDRYFQALCFLYADAGIVMKHFQERKISDKEIELTHHEYDEQGNKVQVKRLNCYELYELDNIALRSLNSWNTERYSYVLKCSCPSTEKEHWHWIEKEYSGDALTAAASTFRIHENIIPHIKCVKRQGNILICELKKEIIPQGFPRVLTPAEYFGFLEVEI